jgi:hypothetical protein
MAASDDVKKPQVNGLITAKRDGLYYRVLDSTLITKIAPRCDGCLGSQKRVGRPT